MPEHSSIRHRDIKTDLPWLWQSKNACRRIRDAFDATNNVASALALYGALCEIASDKASESFQTTHAYLQSKSGVGVSTIKKHLAVFVELGLVFVSTPKLRAPSTYILTSLANHGPSLGNGCPALANGASNGGLATLEESEKKIEKDEEELLPLASGRQGKASSKPRDRNPLFDALAISEGSDPLQLTKPGSDAIAVALSYIKQADPNVTPDEIAKRARKYQELHPTWAMTARALAKNWAACGKPKLPNLTYTMPLLIETHLGRSWNRFIDELGAANPGSEARIQEFEAAIVEAVNTRRISSSQLAESIQSSDSTALFRLIEFEFGQCR